MHSRSRRLGATVLLAVLAWTLTACSQTDEHVSTAPVVVPGRPGEEATVLPPGSTFTPDDGLEDYSAADVEFVAAMIPHHEQAVQMAQLAPGRAQDATVIGLADRIADVQGPEIDVYRRWLSDRGLDASGGAQHGGHGDGDGTDEAAGRASGMASAEELDRLEDSTGAAFDRLWLELMIRHHEGAIEMAEARERAGGRDVRAGELAADVVVTQLDEVHRMEDLLAGS